MRFIKISGDMGPKGLNGFFDTLNRVESVRLSQADLKVEITLERLRSLSTGGLVIYSVNPVPQALSAVTAYCRKIGLEVQSGDTDLVAPNKIRMKQAGLAFVSVDPTVKPSVPNRRHSATISTAKQFSLPDLANPETYLALGTTENINTAIKMAQHALTVIDSENTRQRVALESTLKKSTPDDMEAIAAFVANLAAKRKEAFTSFREEASKHGAANIR